MKVTSLCPHKLFVVRIIISHNSTVKFQIFSTHKGNCFVHDIPTSAFTIVTNIHKYWKFIHVHDLFCKMKIAIMFIYHQIRTK